LDSDSLFWRDRYREQAGWSRDTRRAIFDQLGITKDARLLEVGSGFGAVLGALQADGYRNTTGLDIDLFALQNAESDAALICADGLRLPWRGGAFDACLCHYFLLWVADPLGALREMAHATAPGGRVIALAEPDYGGRMDYPPELEALGRAQREALAGQGADIRMGRRLGELFTQAGLAEVTFGVLPARWQLADADTGESEWRVLERDLAGRVPADELAFLREREAQARASGARALYVPTFYAYGRVN
jgi:SAM-dependent methyltransferase